MSNAHIWVWKDQRGTWVGKVFHLGPFLYDFGGEKADAPLALYAPLLGLGVGATAMVDESQNASLSAGVDNLPLPQVHHELVLFVGVEEYLTERKKILCTRNDERSRTHCKTLVCLEISAISLSQKSSCSIKAAHVTSQRRIVKKGGG